MAYLFFRSVYNTLCRLSIPSKSAMLIASVIRVSFDRRLAHVSILVRHNMNSAEHRDYRS
ncbi:hypothetical protein PILCRDRAFT_825250 [Piloderma croceum F 1598]|uniref:Uncharacterized protein n=1 Tax=Piloderma croceum (strain F 1598) TaxID=765440 RepID=A0A0C3FC78_PILCF|nr:hypothetical protein PILCRDRAFT_825250 [Piloderma croceum F 1598]